MTYDCFINILKRYESERIKAASFPNSCSLMQIPSAFCVMLPDVMQILQHNIAQLCEPDESIAIFSMQPAGGFLTSEHPRKHNRSIHAQVPDYHLCCSLDYLPVKPGQRIQASSWAGFKSVVIDFTRGLLVDQQQYLHELFSDEPAGTVLGELDNKKLACVWEAVHSDGYLMMSGRLCVAA